MPNSTAADLAQSRMLIEVRRHTQARDRLARVVSAAPDSDEAWCLLALCESVLHEPGQMLAAAERAAEVSPGNEWAHRLRSYALSELDQHTEALAAAREAVRLAPESWKCHVALARALKALGLAECIRAARHAVELAPDQPEAHFVLGYVSMDALFVGDLAERSFRRVLELDPTHAAAREHLDALDRGEVPPAAAPPPPPPAEVEEPASPAPVWPRLKEYLRAAVGRTARRARSAPPAGSGPEADLDPKENP